MLVKGISLLGGALLTTPTQTRAETWEDYKLYQILQDCKSIPGSFRYVAVTNGGGVLETAGGLHSFPSLNTDPVPSLASNPARRRILCADIVSVAIVTAGSLDLNYVGPYELTYPPYGMFMTIAGPNSDKHLVRSPPRAS